MPRIAHEAGQSWSAASAWRDVTLAVSLGEHLGEMVLVEPHVLGFGQLDHMGHQRGIERMRRAPSALAVDQSGGALRLVAPAKPPHLANRDAEQAGYLRIH